MFLLVVIIPKSGILSYFSKLRWNYRSCHFLWVHQKRHVCPGADICTTTYNKTAYILCRLELYRLQEWFVSRHSGTTTHSIVGYIGSLFHEKTIFFLRSFSFSEGCAIQSLWFIVRQPLLNTGNLAWCYVRCVKICSFCDAWFWEEHKCSVIKNRALRRNLGLNTEEGKVECKETGTVRGYTTRTPHRTLLR
jgi:hypothetical protein